MMNKVPEYIKDNKLYIILGVSFLAVLLVGAVMSQFGTMSSGNLDTKGETQQLAASGDLAYDTRTGIPPRGDSGGDPTAEEKKVITTYDMRFEVVNVRSAMSTTQRMVEDYNGWVDNENYNSHRSDSGSMTVRVPTQNVSEFLDEAEGSWKLENKNKNTRDVTDRYTEMSLELKNKRQELNQLERMMNRTEEVDSLIKIQERMSQIRSRVQYLENQLQDIDRKVDYTEIRISFEEPQPITSEFEIRETFRNAYQGIFASLKFIIVGTGYLLPFAVLIGLIHFARKTLK